MKTRKHNFLLLMFPFIQGLNKGKRSKPIPFSVPKPQSHICMHSCRIS